MVVKHNLQAMNANRMLGITTKTASGSTEKLSSGYKINRAADDAAGLAISEKMRKQVRGLTKASANAEDGVSAVQTAEGALAEVHDMLQRMNELCVQAANGTNSESDRGYIQDEIEQLTTEIDRIAQTTKFNEIYLLNGNGQTEVQTLEAHDAGLKGTLVESGVGKSVFTAAPMKVGDVVKIGDQEYTIADSDRADKYTSINSLYTNILQKDDKIVQDGVTYTVKTAGKPSAAEYADDNYASTGNTAAEGTSAVFVDDRGNEVALTIKEGATLTRAADGKTSKLVGSKDIYLTGTADTYGVRTDGSNLGNTPEWAAGDVISANGKTYIYDDTKDPAGFYDDITTYTAADGDVLTDAAGNTYTWSGTAWDPTYTVVAGDTLTTANGDTYIYGGTAAAADWSPTYTPAAGDVLTDVAGNTYTHNGTAWVDDTGTTATVTYANGDVVTTAAGVTHIYRAAVTEGFHEDKAYVPAAGDTYLTASGESGTIGGWVAGDKIIDEDGVEYEYVDANGILNNVEHEDAGFYKTEGNKAGDIPYSVKAGDTYIIKATGEKDKVSNGGIATIETIKKALKAIENNNSTTTGTYTVRIQDSANDTPGKTYKIGATTGNGLYTADDVANLVQAGNYVTIIKGQRDYSEDNYVSDEQYYALPPESTERNNISVEKAYILMANELKAASDIGADKGSESVVKNNGDGTFEITHAHVEVDSPIAFNLHVGADADLTNKVTIDIRTITTKGLGLQGLNVKDSTGNGATYALDAVTDALRIVSTQRSLLGAAQNRLEHTINNLDNIIENTTSAEANIRDTDMAEEMVSYANTQVLMQAGQSILAQANQANQGVLSLLQ